MYKDKDRQREANKERQRRYKAKQKALLKDVTSYGVTEGVALTMEEKAARFRALIADKPKPERTALGNIRVSKPGDADYEPQCETTRAYIEVDNGPG